MLSCNESYQHTNDTALINNDSIFSLLCKKQLRDSAVHTAFQRASLLKQQNKWKDFASSLMEMSDSCYKWKQKHIQLNAIDTLLTCEKQLANDTGARVFLAKAIKTWTGENFQNEFENSVVERMKIVWQIYQTDTSVVNEAFYIANKLGIAYNTAGDYPQAQYYYRQCFLDDVKRMKKKNLASDVINGSILLNELGNYDSAVSLIQFTLSVPGILAKQQSSLLANLAAAYAGKKKFDSAAAPLLQGFAILDTIKDKTGLEDRYATLYNVKANIQQQQQQYQAAIKTLQQCLVYTIAANNNSYFNRYVGKVFTGMADNFFMLRQYDSALAYYHKALHTVVAVDSANVLSLPLLKNIYAENTIMDALDGKAKTLAAMYQLQHAESLAQTALDCYSLAFTAENKLLALYDYEQSKLLQLQSSKSRSENAIELCDQLNKQTGSSKYSFTALQFAEKSKAIVLLQSIKKNLTAQNVSPSDTLLSKARSLQLRIVRKDADIHEALTSKSSETNKLLADKTKLTGELQTVQSQIKSAYPQLVIALSMEDTLAISSIQKNILDTATSIVEYFKGDSAAYVFYINSAGDCIMQMLNKSFDNTASAFTHYFQSPENIAGNPAAYKTSASNMYRLLFPFASFSITPQLIIIPDGSIGYIPFEALITDTANAQSLKQFSYLLKQTNISHGYSIASLMEKKESTATNTQLAAFAPAFSNNERDLAPLGFSKEELASIQHQFSNGKYFLNADANISTLRSRAQQCGLLHIATHASAQLHNSEPRIEMIDSTLTLSEIYTWHINAHLVTLSACETGIGNIEKSEGPMSLARGFYYAGAQNVITSLWQVNDAATKNIFAAFYKNINSNTLSQSLQHAKLQYLQNSSGAAASPYYWAGFIYIGSSSYQLPPQSHTWWFVIAAIIMACSLIVFKYRKRKDFR
ncbi:MAG TPA: CHAT domain-containing protein [Chitinophagaceae bacterium]|nr:CHAT domain-containing protein [Chitinophagaceae bacterium]